MQKRATEQRQQQREIFATYQSLNLADKLYEVKALRLAEKYFPNISKKRSLLDIGCADGGFASYAGKLLGAKTYGLDIAPLAVKKAKGVLDQAITHDVVKPLPFPDKSFDLVFALEVIEHVYDTDFLLDEIRRVLRPGGISIISTPNLASFKNRARLLLNLYPQYLEYSALGAGHIHLYTTRVLSSQMVAHGLKLRKMVAANFPAPFITRPFAPQVYREIMLWLGDHFPALGSHIVIIVER